MKAIQIDSFGGPDQLRLKDIDRPQPGAGELLVKLAAAAVNPVDWMTREGMMEKVMPHALPLTPGCELAGTVEQGGDGFNAGDEIYAYLDLRRLGAFAEYAIVKTTEAARKPETMDFIHSASVPVGALTAWQALFDTAGLTSGQTVLIHAAAGGVGSMAVQLAKRKGAHVIGTASESNREYLIALGVDEAIDYRKTHFETAVKHVDVVLDTIGGETQEKSLGVLKPGGMLVSLVAPPPQREGIRTAMIGVQPNGARLAEIARMIDDGELKTLVENVFTLDEAAKALALSQKGRTRGKIVLRVD